MAEAEGHAASPVIGVFDSGVGGLSILRHVRTELPDHDVVYLADQAHAPYGERSLEWVRERSHSITRYLLDLGAAVVVVACNTASAAALRSLRFEFPAVPFVGMEPAVKPAAESTERGMVGVLATRATFQGELYASVVDRHAGDVGVVERVGAGLVELVESGLLEGVHTEALVATHVKPMLAAGVDTVVLGCTHYPFLLPVLRKLLGPEVMLIDPGPAVARQAARLTRSIAVRPGRGSVRFLTSGDPDRFAGQVEALLGIGGAGVDHVADAVPDAAADAPPLR